MRIAAINGRLSLLTGPGEAADVQEASSGLFGPDPMTAFLDWHEFRRWAASVASKGNPFDRKKLGPPVPRPPQIVAIGLNYREHGYETGYAPDTAPVTFTKFASSLTGAEASVKLPEGTTDWEVELVLAIGVGGRKINREDAWSHVAGLMVGQDLSERTSQFAGPTPQFSMAKSHPGFAPVGPWLTTLDEFANPDDLRLSCSIDGEVMQDSRTSKMIYDVPELIVRLSEVISLMPGDLIFTGTPSGVGYVRTPPRFLKPGEVLESTIEGLGDLRTTFV